MPPRKLPHELCIGLTGKVKLKPTPDAAESQTVIYARAKPGRVTAIGAAPAANPWVPMLQAHIQLNSLGSTQITSK